VAVGLVLCKHDAEFAMTRNLRREPQPRYTLEEYFALEKAGDRRYEYWDGEIVSMSGGSLAHAQISGNVFAATRSKLEGRDCQTFTADMPIKTPTLSPYRCPDASAICGDVQIEKTQGIDVLLNPILIVEVLSPESEDRDRNEKRSAYQAIPSVREYLVVSQEIPRVTPYSRDGEVWRRSDYSKMGEKVELPSLGIALTLSDIYQGVTFE
jgi:Uma2 family endonuclease